MLAFFRKSLFVMGSALLLAISSARAASMSPDPSGIWYDPAQPGWGMSINQQGDTMFVALFLYDASHKPTWLVASNVVDTGHAVNFLVGEAFAGPLYRTSGPLFSSSTDTAALGVTTVGSIQVARIGGTANIALAYTVDGVTVNKTVQPQTWNSDIADMLGTLNGGIFLTAPSSCQSPLPIAPQSGTFTVSKGTASDSLVMTWGTGLDTACTMTGTYVQQGTVASLAGPVKCGPLPNPNTDVGTLTISEMAVGPYGFSGAAVLQSGSCAHAGTVGGMKEATIASADPFTTLVLPYFAGLWYDPAHPGWGTSIVVQGDNAFAIIFVYDANHQPEWFVASNVVDTGQVDTLGACFGGVLCAVEKYAGPLYRTSGPFLGSPDDRTSLGVTSVGTLQIETDLHGPGLQLQYSVDGQTVTKHVQLETWSTAAPDIAGAYAGEFLGVRAQSCGFFPSAGHGPADLIPASPTLSVTQDSSATQIAWSYGVDGVCVASATYFPIQRYFSGPLRCTSARTGETTGNLSIFNMSLGAHGFSGSVSITLKGSCDFGGTIGGVKR